MKNSRYEVPEEYEVPGKIKDKTEGRIYEVMDRALLIGSVIGFLTGATITAAIAYKPVPVSYKTANLNGDNKSDLIVTYSNGRIEEKVQMENGSFKTISPEEKEAIKEEARIQFLLRNNVEFSR